MQSDDQDVNNKWEQEKTAYLQTSKACLGTRETNRIEWITADTWQAINTRKDLKKQLIEAKSRD